MRRKPGFTLVELLIVIGIIATLIALFLPALNRAREQARMVICQSNQRQIVIACLAYANNNQGWLPLPLPSGYLKFKTYPYTAICMTGFAQYDWTNGALWPYVAGSPLSRQRVFNCPSDGTDPRPTAPTGTPDPTRPRNFSYNLNGELVMRPPPIAGSLHALPVLGVRLNQIRHPEHKLLVMEMEYPVGPAGGVNIFDSTAGVRPLLSRRHMGFANEAMADGHVERVDPEIFDGTDSGGSVAISNDAYLHYYLLTDPH